MGKSCPNDEVESFHGLHDRACGGLIQLVAVDSEAHRVSHHGSGTGCHLTDKILVSVSTKPSLMADIDLDAAIALGYGSVQHCTAPFFNFAVADQTVGAVDVRSTVGKVNAIRALDVRCSVHSKAAYPARFGKCGSDDGDALGLCRNSILAALAIIETSGLRFDLEAALGACDQ